jgi:hypothetical protein
MQIIAKHFILSIVSLMLVMASTAQAKPLSESEVPGALKAWIPWVMHDVQKTECPFYYIAQDQRVCIWPTSLALNFNRTEGFFAYKITIYDTPDGNLQRIILPGQTDIWPQDVSVNGRQGEVLLFNGQPSVLLSKGEYSIQGNYAWDKMPVSFTLPQQMGIVTLSVNGSEITIPEIENGQLLLQRQAQTETQADENRLELKVFRKITDSIPQIVETRLQLNVSGKQREEVLGQVLPEGASALNIQSQSDIPARLDADGKLRVQLRAGSYSISIVSRLQAQVNRLALPPANARLPAEEIWSFEAQNNLRLVQVSGALAIDPTQTELPQEWHALPSYYLKQGDALEIKEIKRGASESSPDQLTLQRKLWLDFGGSGYTVQDTINGVIKNSNRLEVQDGQTLGSATINGQDQYITTIEQDGKPTNPGVEVREGTLSLQSNSRFERTSHIPATGWKSNFDSVSATLYLPPGWSLFNYSGVDDASYSWVKSWTLVDIFLVMITAVAAYRFWGMRLGIIAGVGLFLIHPEFKSFTSYLLSAILFMAIARALKPGKLQHFMGLLGKLTVLLLILSALPFMLTHMREAIYPQLEKSSAGWQMPAGILSEVKVKTEMGADDYGRRNRAEAINVPMAEVMPTPLSANEIPPPPPPIEPPEPAMLPPVSLPSPSFDAVGSGSSISAYKGKGAYLAKSMFGKADNALLQQYQSYAPDTKVQTGFGNRNISEQGIILSWNGSVDPSVDMRLWLVSNNMNLALSVIRVCLIALMVAALIGGLIPRAREKMRFLFPLILLFLFLSGVPISSAVAEDEPLTTIYNSGKTGNAFPPQPLLDTLKAKLSEQINKPQTCLPECASLSRTRIKASANQLDMELEIHADADVAVPLPGGISSWRPSAVLVNGAAASSLMADNSGYLVVKLAKGVSKVRLLGAINANRDTMAITFPMASRFTSADANGWGVQGIRENGITESLVQLNRTQRSVETSTNAENNFEKTVLPPFYQVERTISLGNRWEVATVVRKLTPLDAPSAIEIPLLDGESVTSSDTQVKGGKAYASFDQGVSEVYFTSVIPQGTSMTLNAPKQAPWVEIWKLSASNLWHVKANGIPRIYEANTNTPDTMNVMLSGASGYSLWMPWPGEMLTFTIERPAGVEGVTRTIDATNLRLMPSDRSTDVSLEISLRSSLGGQHDVTLPEGAVLSDVTRSGLVIPTQMKGNVLTLPLTPGSNPYKLMWKEARALGASYRPSSVDIGADRSVNATVNISMPQNRWILFTTGPLMGPAVLFWSWLPVILILAFGLGKIQATPLRMRHWFVLLMGLSFSSTSVIVMIIAWVLVFAWRGSSQHEDMKSLRFNVMQIVLVLLTIIVMPMLFDSIKDGLLGYPQMNIQGNGSTGNQLNWYQDITASVLPQPLVVSVPIWVYRALMLIWALWLAFKMVNWLRWSWDSFTLGGYWRKVWDKKTSNEETMTAQESETKA